MTERRRVPATLAVLALIGAAIAGYLAAFELELTTTVWDPFFGDGSRRVLTSAIAQLLPVPDAVLGEAAYAMEFVLAAALVLGARAMPTTAILAALALAAAAVAVVLTGVQVALWTFCSLCLGSAAISIALAAGALLELSRVRAEIGVPTSGGMGR